MELSHPLWVDVRGTFLKLCEGVEVLHFSAVCVFDRETVLGKQN